MQLTIKEFFDKYPVLKQSGIADLVGMHQTDLHRAAKGQDINTKQFAELKRVIKQLGKDLAAVDLNHTNFREDRSHYKFKQSNIF